MMMGSSREPLLALLIRDGISGDNGVSFSNAAVDSPTEVWGLFFGK